MFAADRSQPPVASRTSSHPTRRARAGLAAGLLAGLRRGLALGTGTALAAGLLAGVAAPDQGAPDPGALRPAAAAASSPPLRTFTLNVAFSLGTARARADMQRALTGLDASIGGFQEISQPKDRASLIALLKQQHWGWYIPESNGRPIPVVWDRDRFQLIEGRSFMVHGPVGGAPARYINVVQLREISTGLVFGVINTHTIPSASRDAQASNPKRIPYLRKHLRILHDEIVDLAGTTDQVVAMGDLNVNYLADRRRQVAGLPTKALGPVVNFDMPLEGSHGKKSLLDYMMSVKGGSLTRTAGRIAHGFNSDHDAVVVTYDVDAAPVITPDPAPETVFEPGPVTNALGKGEASARVVLDSWSRALDAARPGTLVRVASPRIRDAAITRDLLAADDRGVNVRVLVNGGARTDRERQLAGALGGGSWLRATAADSRASFLLVEHAGGTPKLTLSTSAPLAPHWASHTLTDAYQETDPDAYAAFVGTFQALAWRGAADARRAETPVGEDVSVRFGPFGGQQDPVAQELRAIRCTATSPRTRNGQTQVRVVVRAWRGARGLSLARKLARRDRWGCNVRILAGPGVGRGVTRVLRRGGVDVRQAPVTGTLLLVDGRYGDDVDAQLTSTGTGTFDPAGLRRVTQTLLSREMSTLATYRKQFEGEWRRG